MIPLISDEGNAEGYAATSVTTNLSKLTFSIGMMFMDF
jgi:hypothetical protein